MPLFLALGAVVGGLPAVPALGWRGALAFGCLVSAWLLFGRVVAVATLGRLLTRLGFSRARNLICSAVIDLAAVLGAARIDRRLVWGAVAAAVFSEGFYAIYQRRPRRPTAGPKVTGRKILLIGGEDDEFGIPSWGPRGRACHLEFRYRGKSIEAQAWDYFEAFCQIRLELEKEHLLPFCYGASLNVFPVGLARDMAAGLRAYRLTLGKGSDIDDLVDLFAEGPDVIPATVSQQRDFFQEWMRAPRS